MRREWKPGGLAMPGADTEQCNLAAIMTLARETLRLRFNAIKPGFTPNTGLGRESNLILRFLGTDILPLLAPFMKYWSSRSLERGVRLRRELDSGSHFATATAMLHMAEREEFEPSSPDNTTGSLTVLLFYYE